MNTVSSLSFLDYSVVVAFFAVMLGVGAFYGRKSKSTAQFFGGDKSVPWWLSGVSFYMNSFSALAFVMYSALAYKYGWVPVTVSWLSVPAILLGLWFVALKWRRSATSSPIEFLRRRFGPKMNQAIVWLGIPMQVLDSAFKLLAIGTVVGFVIKAQFPGDTLDKALAVAILVSGAVIVSYTFMGGLKAALVCDFIQFFVILAVVLALPFFCLKALAATAGGEGLAAGWAAFADKAPAGFVPHSVGEFFRALTADIYTWPYMFFSFLLVGLNLATTWSLIQRYASTRSERDAKKMGYLVAALQTFSPPLFFFPAMAATVFIPGLDKSNGDVMNGVYALVCLSVLPAGMIGMMVAAMFSATMSTLAGTFNAISNVVTSDFYARVVNRNASPRALMFVARGVTLFVGAIVIVLTFVMRAAQKNGNSDLFDISNKMFSVFLPPIAISMLLGVLLRRETKRAGLAGLLGGIGVGFVCFVISFHGFPALRGMMTMTSITSLTTIAVAVLASFALKDSPEDRADVERFFDQIGTPQKDA